MDKELQRRVPDQKNKDLGVRSMTVSAIRAVEGEGNERRRILSFSSEEPYLRWFGPEILAHSEGAVDLARLNEIGVLLFNHKTDEVVGKVIRAWIEDKRGCAEVEFDTDEAAEVIYQKVVSGTLKGVSVRYSVGAWEQVAQGAASSDGFAGPCDIARKWTPLEISIVSVPADPTVGVERTLETGIPENVDLSYYEKQIQFNQNLII